MRFPPLPKRAALFLLMAVLVLLALPAAAQSSGPAVSTTMATVKSIAVALLRAGMAVGTMIALVKVTKNFLSGNPNSFSSFMWLIGGVFVFFLWGAFFRENLGTWSNSASSVGSIGNSSLNRGVSLGAYLMAEKVLEVMLTTVVPVLLFTTVALTVIRGFISSGSVQFELGPIARVFFMYIMLVNYNNVVPLVGDLIGGLANTIANNRPSGFSSTTTAYSVLSMLRDADNKTTNPSQTTGDVTPANGGNQSQDNAGLLSGLSKSIGNSLTTFAASFSPANIITGFATDFITALIQAVMEFIQSFLLGFLYVSGPIALSFSLLPGFGGLAKSWLQSLISIHMWSIAFQVIAGLFMYYQASDSALQFGSAGSTLATVTGVAQMKFVVGSLVFIIMYLMVPYMTSLIVGSSGADGFVGSAIRVGAAVASGAVTGGAGTLGAAGAGAKAVNSLGSGASATSQAGTFMRGAASHMGGSAGESASQLSKMFSGGGGGGGAQEAPAPVMSGAANQMADASPIRSSTSEAPVPTVSGGSSSVSGSAGGGSGSVGYAQQVAAPAAAAGTPSVVANPGSSASSAEGGSSRGFGRNVPARSAVAAAPAAVEQDEDIPRLTGGR